MESNEKNIITDPSIPSGPLELSDNEELNYQINTTSSKNANITNITNINASAPKNREIEYKKPQSSNELENLINEKNNLLETLRKEMICNEEQRNYINILKETIESSLFKNGIGDLIQESNEYQNYKNQREGQTITDFFIDFTRNKSEIESLKNEFNTAKNIIKDNKDQIFELKKNLEEESSENIILKENINKILSEKTELEKEKIKTDKNYENLSKTNLSLRNQNKTLKEQLLEYQAMSKVQLNQIQSINTTNQTNEFNMTKYHELEERLNNINTEYENLKFSMIQMQKDKAQIEEEANELKAENAILANKLNNIHSEHETLLLSYTKLQNELESLRNQNITRENVNVNDAIQSKQDESYETISNLQQRERELTNEKGNYEKMLSDYIQKNSDLKIDNENIRQKLSEIDDKYKKIEEHLTNEINENKELKVKLKEATEKHNELLIQVQSNQMEYHALVAEKANYDNEKRYWKNKYEKDAKKTEDEFRDINMKINQLINTKEKVISENEQLRKYNNDFNNKYRNKCENEQRLIKERDKYKELYLKENKKYEDSIREVKRELKKNNTLANEKIKLENKITNLNDKLKEENKQKMAIIEKFLSSQNLTEKTPDILSKALNDLKNIDNYNILSNNFKDIMDINPIQDKENLQTNIEQYIIKSAKEIQLLTEELSKSKLELQNVHNMYLETEEAKKELISNNISIQNNCNMLTEENEKLSRNNYQLHSEIEHYKDINNQLRLTCDNFNKNIENKDKLIEEIRFQLNSLNSRSQKIENDREIYKTVLLRLCKLLPNLNLYKTAFDLTDERYDIEEREEINRRLMIEIKRAEDYIKSIKDNSLEVEYINRNLSRQLEGANMLLMSSKTTNLSSNNNSNGDSILGILNYNY